MITRNSQARFTPDLCSRVTFVNFTVTQSSLENQCINIFLKNERPDIEKKRLKLLKLQGEFLIRIRELEDDLLNKISESQGSILENEPLIKTLDNLKVKANEVTQEMKESDKVLKEVQTTTNEYNQIAYLSAKLYFTLKNLTTINSFYQFSFSFYMNIIMSLLAKNDKLNAVAKEEYSVRIDVILEQLFVMVYHAIEPSIKEKDKLLIAIRLC